MLFNKILRSSLICLILLTAYNFALAEEPNEPVSTNKSVSANDEKANENASTNAPTNKSSLAKRTTVNGVNIVFTGNNEAFIEVNGQLVKINTVTQNATVASEIPTSTTTETTTVAENNESSPANTANTAENPSETAKAETPQSSEVEPEPTEVNPEDYYAYELVNLPTPKRYEKGAFSVHFTHRFSQSPFARSAADLFGFDSFSISAFGFTYGITDRIYAKVFRTPSSPFRTIEMGGGVHLLQQGKVIPISAALYASVEGRDNFNEHFTTNISGTIGRSFSRYGGIFFAPTVSFNNNPIPNSNPGKTNTTGSFGFGGQINFRPTGSFVMEFVPRVGYKSPGSVSSVAFGLQKRTYRHTFTLTVSNTQSTTTSQYNAGFGSITDRKEFARALVIGFNIYRRFF
jgi:hypothetical protein